MSLEGPSSVPLVETPYERIVSKTAEQHRLFAAHWEITYRCNEKCTHCYLDVFSPNTHVPGELTTDEGFRLIDQLAELGALNLSLSGGEMLVRHDWFELAQYAHSKKFLLRFFTNGTLITPLVADRIASLHPYAVEISVYGADAETHDKITTLPRSFELTMRAFRLLRERGIRTVVKTPLMRENVRQFHAIKQLAEDLGARYQYDATITPKSNGGRSPLQHRLTYSDYLWLFHETIQPEHWLGRQVTPDSRTCGIARNAVIIDPYGNIFPCMETHFMTGNLRQQPLKEIWETSPVWNELGKLTVGELPVCRTCEIRTLCVRCHGLALNEDGDLRGPASINCEQALARRQVLVEKGTLPADYPIPAHLRNRLFTDASASMVVPLTSLTVMEHRSHSNTSGLIHR